MATILTVDDSGIQRRIIAIILTNAGHTMVEAGSGAEALQILAGKTVDLVITDLRMPHMDGIELTRQLRTDNNFKSTPILILTADTGNVDRLRGKEVGATGWVVKPFTPPQLTKVVAKVLLNLAVDEAKESV
jgi:two-component system chemotaxis response regulator CheY